MALFRPSTWTWFGGPKVTEGVQIPLNTTSGTVNFDSAMTVSAYWASAKLLSEAVAAMPLQALKKDGEGRTQNSNYKLWRILNYQPNQYQTRTEFLETLMLNLVTWGNCYAKITRDAGGNVISLNPLMSSQMQVEVLTDGTLVYTYQSGQTTIVYAASEVWHVKLFGNGIVGLSTLSYASKSIQTSINTRDRTATLAANGGKPAGFLIIDKQLTPQQREEIRKNYSNLDVASSQDTLRVLENGMKYEQLALSPADMQLLENRKYSVEDIARFMGVPSVLINDTSGSTTWGSGIEQIMDGFYKLNLRPYLERLESSIKKHLMPMSDWDDMDIEFNFDSLLRADRKTRMESNSAAINSAQLTPNEARKQEGLRPLPGGDTIYLNGTLVPAGMTPLRGGNNAN